MAQLPCFERVPEDLERTALGGDYDEDGQEQGFDFVFADEAEGVVVDKAEGAELLDESESGSELISALKRFLDFDSPIGPSLDSRFLRLARKVLLAVVNENQDVITFLGGEKDYTTFHQGAP